MLSEVGTAKTQPGGVLSLIMRTPFYRGAVISLFLSGLGNSAANPQITLFLVRELGASLPVAGLYFLTNLAAPLIGFAIGSLADRRTDRLPLFRLGAVLGAVGWIAMAFTTQVWMPFLISVTVLGISGATGSLIYAVARDELSQKPSGMDNRVMSTIRMAYSIGFVIGPVVGSIFGDALGLRAMLIGTGICTLLQIVPLLRHKITRVVEPRPAKESRAVRRARKGVGGRRAELSLAPLLIFLGLGVLAMCGDTIRFAYLPIYMEQQLNTPDALRGAVISTQSFLMLLLIPIVGLMAERFGAQRLVVAGTIFGVAGNVGFYLSDTVIGLFMATALLALQWSALGGLGVVAAQDLYPSGVGMASTMFFSATRFSGAIGGAVGALGAATIGIPGVFLLPAILGLLAFVGLTIQVSRTPRL